MKEYGLGYTETLRLPLRTFWSLNRQVNRLRAEQEQRIARVYNSSQSAEGATALFEALQEEIGSPVIFEKPLDEDKFLELQERLGQVA